MSDLDGQVAIVTGAARGIGLRYAQRLAGAGARVALADLDHEAAAEAAAGIERDGGVAPPVPRHDAPPPQTLGKAPRNPAG
jgi:NAD(P)-dependent dehydrogenase (short-subunit alcohol dehydrogenase family)